MCDTLVATREATADNSMIFGKNSDREPNEAASVEYHPRQKHGTGETIKCTYISVPQVEETNEIVIVRPFWMWGAEMGGNEHGVVIGNEAVWTKEPTRETGLLGMDLLRLALERASTAKEAMDTIIELLEQHGQGGPGGYTDKKFFYHNSYILADATEAWVLETADKYWIAEKVKGVRSISNTLSIGTEYDLAHPDLLSHARAKGYLKSGDEFHFADAFTPSFNITHIGAKGSARQACTTNSLLQNQGKVTPGLVMGFLRNHNIDPSKEARWNPSKGSMKCVCLHATSFLTPSQSVSSHVAHIKDALQVHWMTCTSAPCTSLYKPVFLPGAGLGEIGAVPGAHYDPGSVWWQHEKLHRLVLRDYQHALGTYRGERDEIEARFLDRVHQEIAKIPGKPTAEDKTRLKAITTDAFSLAKEKTNEWIERIQGSERASKPNFLYRGYWKKINKHDRMDGLDW